VAPPRRVRQALSVAHRGTEIARGNAFERASQLAFSVSPLLFAASFLGIWVGMMVVMLLPSLVSMLWRYRQVVGRTGETRSGRLTALVGVG